jgi:proliferating cell nuclear antigen
VLMINFFKIIRVLSGNDTLTLFIEEGMNHKMGIRIENADKNTVTTYYMNLIDVDHTQFNIPPIEFPSIITMPSSEFNKICRDMNNIGDVIEIKSIDNHLMFSCEGEFASQETVMGEKSNGLNFVKSENTEIIQGYYNLKHLILFTKCTNLSPSVEIYMKNNFMIIFSFTIGSLGSCKCALAPRSQID